ncbi:putative metallo cofactor biosynthesis protein [uncultured delta proteobacterium]|uniref:Putative metallo cofactor biosynthesis protein n=1 Tax=uncultured delta proteobacterium TaxID=34034 RepID=A0A212JWY8_9DELT|nr:putative metallo cofactor biosynthesis protein [uncultured delta proteobacterium]
MRFCARSYSTLVIEPYGLRPCCDGKQAVYPLPYVPYAGGDLTDAFLREYFPEINRQMDANPLLCAGCRSVRNKAVSEEESRPPQGCLRRILINPHRALCNAKCVYCDFWKESHPVYPVAPVVHALMDSAYVSPQCVFNWGGGEAVLLPDFAQTCAAIQERGYPQEVITNSIRYSPAVAHMLADGMGIVRTSLNCSSADLFIKIMGVDKFDAVIENVKRYLDAAKTRDSVEVKYIILEENNAFAEIDAFLELCARIGVTKMGFSFELEANYRNEVTEQSLRCAARMRLQAARLGIACGHRHAQENHITAIETFMACEKH